MTQYSVGNVSIKPGRKRLALRENSGKESHLFVHQFAPVGPGNDIKVDPNHGKRIYVRNKEGGDDDIQISPHFEKSDQLRIGNTKFDLKLTELIREADFQDFKYLEKFHYRGSSAVSMADPEEQPDTKHGTGGGRRAIILCRIRQGNRWESLGYIELSMPLQMVKPRHLLFDRPFDHPTRPVSWSEWKIDAIKNYVNLIVRIGRVVTSPEFRGLGAAKILISAAKEFAKTRWQIAGRRPLFMEISAEMLKYLDFVSSSGFHYAGDTEGNIKRIHKDLESMMRKPNVASGIMTLQKKYLSHLERGAKRLNCTVPSLMDELEELTCNPEKMEALDPARYYLFKSVLRFPIPYYICGLDEPSQSYILEGKDNEQKPSQISVKAPSVVRVKLQDIVAKCNYKIQNSSDVRSIMDSFGLEGDTLSYDVLGPIDIEASAGNIIFIAGVSGSGKSVLLKTLDSSDKTETLQIEFSNRSRPADYPTSWMAGITSDKPIIEYLAEYSGIEQALSALNRAGLAEVFVYLKPYSLLSRGQKYRVRLAELSLKNKPVWLIDEFCADLDPLTAKIVAHNFRKHVIRTKRIAFVAAANNTHFIDALRPARVINLLHGGRAVNMSYREYCDELHEIN